MPAFASNFSAQLKSMHDSYVKSWYAASTRCSLSPSSPVGEPELCPFETEVPRVSIFTRWQADVSTEITTTANEMRIMKHSSIDGQRYNGSRATPMGQSQF